MALLGLAFSRRRAAGQPAPSGMRNRRNDHQLALRLLGWGLVRIPRVPERWPFGEMVVGLGAISLGLGIAAAAIAGVPINPWLLILMPLVVIGAMVYWSRVIGPFPTGVEQAPPTKARRHRQDR